MSTKEYKRRMKNIQSANIKWHTRIFKKCLLTVICYYFSVWHEVCVLFDHVLPAYLMDMMMWVSGKRPMYVPVLLYLLNTVFLTTCPVYNEHACILREDKKSTRLLPFAWTCNKAAFTGNICMLIYFSFIKFLKFYWLIEIFDLWKWKRVLLVFYLKDV